MQCLSCIFMTRANVVSEESDPDDAVEGSRYCRNPFLPEDMYGYKMLNILILLGAAIYLIAGLAKHGRRGRKFRRYVRGNVNELLNISTLAAGTTLSTDFDSNVVESMWASSMVASWSISNWTNIADCGPLLVGVAHSDYTAAEIQQFIDSTGSWDVGDLISQEIGKRKIRIVGTLVKTGADALDMDNLQDGKMIKTKLGFMIEDDDTLQLWAHNVGSAAFATTDPDLRVDGHINLWPR